MIDIIIVFAYLALLLVIGILQRSKLSSFKNFSRATDNNVQKSKLILVATIFASTIGGGTTFGIAEKTFADNISYTYGLLLTIPVDLAIAYYIIPRIIKHYGAESVGDIMYTYYGSAGRYISGISAIMVSVGLVAAQISVSGRIFEYILQINYIHGVILSYGIVVAYTTIGGFKSVLFTNQLQFFAIVLAIPVISIFGIYKLGISNFIYSIPNDKVSFLSNPNLLSATISATLGFAVMNMFPTFIQRALINKDHSSTSKAIYIKSVIYGFFLIFVTINGLLAFIIFPDAKASLALSMLIEHIIPNGIQGLVVVGLLAAVMSTADSDLNITSITLVKDFLKPIFGIKEQSKMLFFARLINILVGSIAIIIALYFDRVADLVIFIAGFWGPVILAPLILALFGIIVGKKSFVISCLFGAISFISWEVLFSTATNFKGVFIGTVVNLTCFVIFYSWEKRQKI
jgi:solute:Na+ symporter, SSS family